MPDYRYQIPIMQKVKQVLRIFIGHFYASGALWPAITLARVEVDRSAIVKVIDKSDVGSDIFLPVDQMTVIMSALIWR